MLVGVRLIAGRAGSGKTHWCQAQITRALASGLVDGPRLIMLVPEQAALQMERGLVSLSPARTLGRCEVLSFRRLAHRALQSGSASPAALMTPLGRQMALRHLMIRHRKSLREFGRVSDRAGFVAGTARAVVELLQESVTIEQIERASEAAASAGDPSGPRLHDVALIYRAYLEYLGSERVDPEGVLDLARTALTGVSWIDGARLFIDGFAGLAEQQVRMVVALAQRTAEVNISLLLDPERACVADPEGLPDNLSLMSRTERTWQTLVRALRTAGVAIEKPVLLGASGCRRFARATKLGRLERGLFQVSPDTRDSQDVTVDSTGHDRGTDPGWSREAATGTDTDGTVHLLQAPDRRREVDAAVRTIVDLTQRPSDPMRYRDIAVIVRNLEPYHDLISASLRAHGAPFFIDRRRPTYHHPLIEFVRAGMAMHAGGSFGTAIAMLLKTGLSGLADSQADALENYQLAHGLMTSAAWEEEWSYPVGGAVLRNNSPGENDPDLDYVICGREALRQRIGAWWPTSGGAKGRPSCRTWIERLYGLLNRAGVPTRLEAWQNAATERRDLDEAAEHEQVWTDLMALFDELAVTLGSEQMTGRQFRDVVESALAEFTLGLVPPTVDQVLVGSIERSRHPSIRAAFVLGFGEGQFPAPQAEDVVLGDSERECLERSGVVLGRTRVTRFLDERMLAYIALTRPCEYLWVSYPESDERGRSLAQSPYWPWVCAALPEVPVETLEGSGAETISTATELAGRLALNLRSWCEHRMDDVAAAPWLALYDWSRSDDAVADHVGRSMSGLATIKDAVLTPEAINALWSPPHRTSVTRLERFAQCPFQHFAAHGLRLAPRAEHGVTTLDMGRLSHVILEQFVNDMIETGRSLSDLADSEIAQRLVQLGELSIQAAVEGARVEEPRRRWMRRRNSRELPPAIVGEKALIGQTTLRPLLTEQVFGGNEPDDLPALQVQTPDGREVLIGGKIDRVDLLTADEMSLAVVFDYKRSVGSRLRLDEVYHGLALQLLTYLLVISDHGPRMAKGRIVPGGTFYLPLLGGYERVIHPDDADDAGIRGYQSFKPRGVFDFDWIDQFDPGRESGWSSVVQAFRTKDGGLGNQEKSDAVPAGRLPGLLKHVRRTLGELAGRWLSGDISVNPSRLGDQVPCVRCKYQSVCRMEYATRQTRLLTPMSRSEVLDRIAGTEADHG